MPVVIGMEYIPPDDRINGGKVPSVFLRRTEAFRWLVICFVGIIIVFIGCMWVTHAMWTPMPKANNYHNNQEYNKALNDWRNATEAGNLYGRMTIEVGAMVMIIGSFLGYVDPAVDETDKRRLLIIMLIAFIVLIIVSVGIVEQSPYIP